MSGDTETGTLLDVAASGGQVHFCSPNAGVLVYNYTAVQYPMFRFSSMKVQGGLNVRMVVTLAPQPSMFY